MSRTERKTWGARHAVRIMYPVSAQTDARQHSRTLHLTTKNVPSSEANSMSNSIQYLESLFRFLSGVNVALLIAAGVVGLLIASSTIVSNKISERLLKAKD